MKIRVELVGQFRDIVGSSETLVEVEEGSTLHELVRKMAAKYGEKFAKRVLTGSTGMISEDVTIVLNGRVIPVEMVSSTLIHETDRVVLMPEAII
ncbi:MAG: MoaD/ThiS family protein [Thermoproteota archaeon]